MISPAQIPPVTLMILVAGVAFLYASVGFGGASGYLAVMSLYAISPQVMSTSALTLNILVSGVAFFTFWRARHFALRLLWPFLLASVPASFLGGILPVSQTLYFTLLTLALSYAALRMLLGNHESDETLFSPKAVPLWLALVSGALIGLLSGIVGIGGGIFLAPLVVLAGWGTPKQAAAISAAFIAINSLSALAGRLMSGSFSLGTLGLVLLIPGLMGGLAGSYLGAHRLSGSSLRRLLGVVLLFAVLRLWLAGLG